MRKVLSSPPRTCPKNSMNASDQKSIFGILVAIAALFLLWLWASGNAATLWAAANGSGTNTSTPNSATNAAPNAGSFGAYGTATPTALNTTVNVPNYTTTIPAIQYNTAGAIGGNTSTGAVSGGAGVTPTVLANSNSVPAIATLEEEESYIQGLLGLGSGSVPVATTGPSVG